MAGSTNYFRLFAVVLRAISFFWVATIAGLGLLIALLDWTSDSSNPSLFGREVLIVTSGSMEPWLGAGDLIVVRHLGPEQNKDLKVGDIITFREQENNDFLVTHRIQEIALGSNGEPSYITKGDANSVADSTAVESNDIVGKLSFKIDNAGFVLTSVEERNLLAFFVLAMILGHLAVKVLETPPMTKTTTETTMEKSETT